MNDVNLKINGIDVTVPQGTTILEAARKLGFDIPTLCNAQGLQPFTSCFVCAVKVEGGKGNFVPSCATKVREGMVCYLLCHSVFVTVVGVTVHARSCQKWQIKKQIRKSNV